MKQVRFALNVGTLDQHQHSIPDGPDGGPPREGDVLSLDDDVADQLCRLVGCCTEVHRELPPAAASIGEEETPRAATMRRKKDNEVKEADT
jgi:hypothetical protein